MTPGALFHGTDDVICSISSLPIIVSLSRTTMPNVSTYTLKRIQSLHEQNLHPKAIFKTLKGEDLAVSYQSVARIKNKLKLTGSTDNLPKSGRLRKASPEAKVFIAEQIRRNDETTSREIQHLNLSKMG